MKWISIFLVSQFSYASIPDINILMGKKLRKVSLSGLNISRRFKGEKKSKQYSGQKTLTFNCFDKRSFANKDLLVQLQSSNEIMSWNNKRFSGKFLVSSKKDEDTCNFIMRTDLDHYVSLLLSKEMASNWPLEALKAQAVAARSYAIYKIKYNKQGREHYFHLENSEKHQVNGSIDDQSKKTIRASLETKNEILVGPENELQEIFYHAHCGGKTKTPDQVWGGTVKGYKSVKCPYCQDYKFSKWEKRISLGKLHKAIKRIDRNVSSLIGVEDSGLYSVATKFYDIASNAKEVLKPRLRKLLGRSFLPSSNFQMINLDDEILIKGQGNGHGVGMCQIGARELAKKGMTYKDILSHYFPKHRIVKIK